MIQKHLMTLLLAVTVTSTTAFGQQDDAPKQEPQEKSKTIKAISEDGKLFIVDDEGNKRELDISGAKSIMIQQSNRAVNNNGDQENEVRGQAVIIGPDGEKTIIELDGANNIELPGLNMRFGEFDMVIPEIRTPDFPNAPAFRGRLAMPEMFRFNSGEAGKFMIGVHCSPVDESLRSHLKLDNGLGLIVRMVTEGSPANGADLQEHDILIYADDSELGSLEDLTAVVESAGEEDRSITLTIVREGGETSAKVTPQKRPENQNQASGAAFRFAPRGQFQIDRMGPGIIVGRDEKMEDVVERLRDQMKQMQEEMQQMMERDK